MAMRSPCGTARRLSTIPAPSGRRSPAPKARACPSSSISMPEAYARSAASRTTRWDPATCSTAARSVAPSARSAPSRPSCPRRSARRPTARACPGSSTSAMCTRRCATGKPANSGFPPASRSSGVHRSARSCSTSPFRCSTTATTRSSASSSRSARCSEARGHAKRRDMEHTRHAPRPASRRPAWRWLPGLVALLFAAGAAAQTRIGYIDQKRLLDNAPQMTAGSERLRREFAERDRQLRADEARLSELQERQRNATTLDEALGDEIEALARKIRRTRETLRDELSRRSQEETAERFREISEVVAAFARENGYDLIVS